MLFLPGTILSYFGVLDKVRQVRSECLTCTFRASCCSACLSQTQVPAPLSGTGNVHDDRCYIKPKQNCGTIVLMRFADKSLYSRWSVHDAMGFWINPCSYVLNQPVLHNWCNKGWGMYCCASGTMHIKNPLLLISMKCWQWVSSLIMWLVLYHVINKMCWVRP